MQPMITITEASIKSFPCKATMSFLLKPQAGKHHLSGNNRTNISSQGDKSQRYPQHYCLNCLFVGTSSWA